MNPFYAPAFWLLGRFSQGASFALVGLLFIFSTVTALALPPDAAWLPAALLAVLGCYGLAAVRAFIARGIEETIALMERIASGELVSGEAQAGDGHAQAGDDRPVARLHGTIQQMNRSLALIVKQVWSSAEAIARGARGILSLIHI